MLTLTSKVDHTDEALGSVMQVFACTECAAFYDSDTSKTLLRYRFTDHDAALAARKRSAHGGGWIIGALWFSGSWSPEQCKAHADGEEGDLV